jgi:hypothetical protein
MGSDFFGKAKGGGLKKNSLRKVFRFTFCGWMLFSV